VRGGSHTAPDDGYRGAVRAVQLLRALRPHQWVKNLLVFAPLVLAQQLSDRARVVAAALAFLAFSLAASGVYVVNDLRDVASDRLHPTKRARPFASGAVATRAGPPLAAVLFVGAAVVSAVWLKPAFGLVLASYVALAVLYSVWLKRVLLVDVFTLTSLYVLRLLAGGYATGTHVTEWLIAFAVFLFTSLAFLKRYTEIAVQSTSLAGRAYDPRDLSVIESVGPASGYLAVLVLALYLNSQQVRSLYAAPGVLWLVCPLLLYWVTRLWFLAKRGDLHDDPVVFACTDPSSLVVGVVGTLLLVLAAHGWGVSPP
jgi:4-hydroxybenzoate polyprenyltransferase